MPEPGFGSLGWPRTVPFTGALFSRVTPVRLVLTLLLVSCAHQRSARVLLGQRVALTPGVEVVAALTGLSLGTLVLQAVDTSVWQRQPAAAA